MKKLLLIFIIIGIVFIAGCIGGEKTTDKTISSVTPTTSQNSQNIQNSDLIIKQEDLPAGFVLEGNQKLMLPKDSVFTYLNSRNLSVSEQGREIRDNKIPNDWKYVHESIGYKAPSGKEVTIIINVFDTDEGIKEGIERSNLAPSGKVNENIEKSGYANIGDYSYWEEDKDSDPYLKYSKLIFSKKNTLINIWVRDDKENGHDLALKVAKLIVGRLG